jgi:hypothetical protein
MGREPRLLGDDAVGGHVPLPTRLQVKAAISRCAAIVTVMLIWVGALPIAVNPPAQAQALGVQSRSEVGWIASEAVRLICPRLTDRFVGR